MKYFIVKLNNIKDIDCYEKSLLSKYVSCYDSAMHSVEKWVIFSLLKNLLSWKQLFSNFFAKYLSPKKVK